MFCFGRILISFTELLNFDSVCEKKNRRKIYGSADRVYQNCKLFQMLKKKKKSYLSLRKRFTLIYKNRNGIHFVVLMPE